MKNCSIYPSEKHGFYRSQYVVVDSKNKLFFKTSLISYNVQSYKSSIE